MKTIFKTLCALAVVYAYCLAGEDDYQRAKESEQLVASFWRADGNRHYSGIEELSHD